MACFVGFALVKAPVACINGSLQGHVFALSDGSDPGSVAQPTSAEGGGTRDLVAARGRASRAWCLGRNNGSSKMTRSGAGRIQTSIKGEAVRCEGALADQSLADQR